MKPIDRQILRLSIPSILANITVPLVGMVDIAVSGHLGLLEGREGFTAAAMIGGTSIGSMLFDLVYWNFSFLRVGTGGLTAQAFGARRRAADADDPQGKLAASRAIAGSFSSALLVAVLAGFLLVALQGLVLWAAFAVVDCTPEVAVLAGRYFRIRIWAAPATLSLFAFKGWFIGMQDTVSPMLTDLIVNGLNIAASIILAFGAGSFKGIGYDGVALGTVIAQWSGFAFALAVVLIKYRKDALRRDSSLPGGLRKLFAMNADLVLRSMGLLAIYIGFTVIAARYGDVMLAVSSIMMKLLMLFSYFSDGFAYAGEALTGKYLGMKDYGQVKATVRHTFAWSMGVAVSFILIYYLTGKPMLRMMTSDDSVIRAAVPFLPWLMVMPLTGCPAFTWDGIFMGATASSHVRNSSLLSAVCFFGAWFLGLAVLPEGYSGADAIHVLMAAYFVHLTARTVYQSIVWRKAVLGDFWKE